MSLTSQCRHCRHEGIFLLNILEILGDGNKINVVIRGGYRQAEFSTNLFTSYHCYTIRSKFHFQYVKLPESLKVPLRKIRGVQTLI